MSNFAAIDADGHIIENENDIRKYLQEPWNRRSTALRPGDQPWDNHMFDSFQSERVWGKLSPREQIARWHELMDEHQIETPSVFRPAPAASSGFRRCRSRSRWHAL